MTFRVVVSYNGDYQTPAIRSIDAAHGTWEAAEYLRDFVIEDLWTAWPVCNTMDTACGRES